MRIELNLKPENRSIWIKKCGQLIEYIENERRQRDKQFEHNWRKRWFWLLPDRLDTEMPPHGVYIGYPSFYMWSNYNFAQNLKAMVEDATVEAITLEGHEYQYFDVLYENN